MVFRLRGGPDHLCHQSRKIQTGSGKIDQMVRLLPLRCFQGKKRLKTTNKKRCRSGIPNRSAFFILVLFSCLVLHRKHVLFFYQVINQRNNGQNQCNPDQHGIQQLESAGMSAIRRMIIIIWLIVFDFPPPACCDDNSLSEATRRKPLMINSSCDDNTTIHAGSLSSSTKQISAEHTSSLSASGSIKLSEIGNQIVTSLQCSCSAYP